MKRKILILIAMAGAVLTLGGCVVGSDFYDDGYYPAYHQGGYYSDGYYGGGYYPAPDYW